MMKRILSVLCFLIFFSPFPAAAMPLSEMTVPAEMISFDLNRITFEFIPGQPLEVVVKDFTEVRDIEDLNQLEGVTSVRIYALSTAEGLIALEVEPSDLITYELKGIITEIFDPGDDSGRTIELLGTEIPVDNRAEIKDVEGIPLGFGELGGKSAKLEGTAGGGSFIVTEITVIPEFECSANTKHIFKALKPAGLTHKMAEHYCELPSGMRGGATQVSFTDYTGQSDSTYTVGKYANGERQGYWLTIDVTGRVVLECLYEKGDLLDGDQDCSPN
jgi:hypothetical protein